jgi:hypothetical protein
MDLVLQDLLAQRHSDRKQTGNREDTDTRSTRRTQTHKQRHTHTHTHTDRKTGRQADRQTDNHKLSIATTPGRRERRLGR